MTAVCSLGLLLVLIGEGRGKTKGKKVIHPQQNVMGINSLKRKVQCLHCLHLTGSHSGLCHLSKIPRILYGTTLLKKLKRRHSRGEMLTTVQVTEHCISAESVQAKLCRDLSLPSPSLEVIQGLVPRETPF